MSESVSRKKQGGTGEEERVASGPAHPAVPHSLLFNTSSLRSILYSFLSYFLGGGRENVSGEGRFDPYAVVQLCGDE